MKFRHWAISGLLLGLVVLAVVAFIATGEKSAASGSKSSASATSGLVDTAPLKTARELAGLALTPEEQRLAQQAARVADHEVDLAFADQLREARESASNQDPKYQELNARVKEAQAVVDQEKAEVARLKAKIATAKPNEQEGLQDQLA